MKGVPASVLLLAVLYGVGLRLWHPERAIYWNDEVWTALQSTGHALSDVIVFTDDSAQHTAADFVKFQRPGEDSEFGRFVDTDPHTSPAYYALCWLAIDLSGDHVMGSRYVTALLACLAIFAGYLATRELFESVSVGGVVAVLMAISPLQVFMAFDARPYALWAVTAPLALYVFLRAHKLNTSCWWSAYAVCAALMVYSHLYSVFMVFGQAAYLLAADGTSRATWRRFGAALAWAALACVPWGIAIVTRTTALGVLMAWLSEPITLTETLLSWRHALLWQWATYETLPSFAGSAWLAAGAYTCVLAVAAFDSVSTRRREVTLLLLILLVGLPIALFLQDVVLGGRRFSISRYYVQTWFAGNLLIAAWSVRVGTRILEKVRQRRASLLRLLPLIAFPVIATTSAAGAWAMARARIPEGKPDAFLLDMAEEIQRHRGSVIVSPGLVTTPLVLSNMLQPSTRIVNVRERDMMSRTLHQAVRQGPVFLLRPAPENVHAEPRRWEALRIERALESTFRVATVAGIENLAVVSERTDQ